MERSQVVAGSEGGKHFRRQPYRLAELFASMHHTVTYGIDFVQRLDGSIFRACQSVQDKFHTYGMLWNVPLKNFLLATGQGELQERVLQTNFSIPPWAITSFRSISNNLYLMDELPQFNTKIFILYIRFKSYSAFFLAAMAWLAVMAIMRYTSSMEQPRERSFTGRAIPCRIGPTASACPRRCTSL